MKHEPIMIEPIAAGYRLYTTEDVLSIVQITMPCMKEWVRHGFIKPAVPNQGKGLRNYYNFANLLRCMLLKELISEGIARNKIMDVDTRLLFQMEGLRRAVEERLHTLGMDK